MSYAPTQTKGSNTMIVALAIMGAICFVLLVCGGILLALLLPAVQSARQAARGMMSQNNMKQIILAIHNYESKYKSLPPQYTVDSQGNKLHSWRTLLLPYMNQTALYQSIDLTKPWNDPVNAFANSIDVITYKSPKENLAPGLTTYLGMTGTNTIFQGSTTMSFRDVADGLANTIFVYEAASTSAVNWMEPQDGDSRDLVAYLMQAGTRQTSIGMGDGRVVSVDPSMSPATLDAASTISGGELISLSP